VGAINGRTFDKILNIPVVGTHLGFCYENLSQLKQWFHLLVEK
jgi:hypothetical protein